MKNLKYPEVLHKRKILFQDQVYINDFLSLCARDL
jgi:hypothetical protein